MSCDFDKEKLTAFFDGEVDATEKAQVEAHIASCSPCLRELNDVKSAATTVRNLTRHAVPATVTEAIRKEIRTKATVSTFPVSRRILPFALATAATILVAITVVAILHPPHQSLMTAMEHHKSAPAPAMEKTNGWGDEEMSSGVSKEDFYRGQLPTKKSMEKSNGNKSDDAVPGQGKAFGFTGEMDSEPKRDQADVRMDWYRSLYDAEKVTPRMMTVVTQDRDRAQKEVTELLESHSVVVHAGAGEKAKMAISTENFLYVDVTAEQLSRIQGEIRGGKKAYTAYAVDDQAQAAVLMYSAAQEKLLARAGVDRKDKVRNTLADGAAPSKNESAPPKLGRVGEGREEQGEGFAEEKDMAKKGPSEELADKDKGERNKEENSGIGSPQTAQSADTRKAPEILYRLIFYFIDDLDTMRRLAPENKRQPTEKK